MRVRGLLPSNLRAAAVMIVVACAGLFLLAWAGGYATYERNWFLGAIGVIALVLALAPGLPVAPTSRTFATVLSASDPKSGGIADRCTMRLRVTGRFGEPKVLTHIDPAVPVTRWPRPGERLHVEVTWREVTWRWLSPKVRIRWDLESGGAAEAGDSRSDPPPDRGDGFSAPNSTGHAPLATSDAGPLESIPILSGTIIDFDEDEYGAVLESSGPTYVDLTAAREPSDLVRRYLFPTEKFRGEWRRHWIRPVKELALGMGLGLLLQSGYRAQFGSVVIDLGSLPAAEIVSQTVWISLVVWRFAAWWTNRFVLTHRRVMLVGGALWRRVSSLSLATARDLRYTQTPLARTLGYGAIRLRGNALIYPVWRVGDLPNPTDLYLQIVTEIFDPDFSEALRRPPHVDQGFGVASTSGGGTTRSTGSGAFDLEDDEPPLVYSPTPPRPRTPPSRPGWDPSVLLFEDFSVEAPGPQRRDGTDETDAAAS